MKNFSLNIISIQIRRIFCLVLLFAFIGVSVNGQNDVPKTDEKKQSQGDRPQLEEGSFRVATPEAKVHKKTNDFSEHPPNKAMALSLVLPGLGQAYNKKYYKIPIIYAALGGVSYWVYYNTQGYRQASANYAEDDNSTNERYLRAWRRNLEISYITTVGVYALQVLDAYVDANLFFWDVSPDLSIRMEPAFDSFYTPTGYQAVNYGFKCKLTF